MTLAPILEHFPSALSLASAPVSEHNQNIVGPQIRKLRDQRGLTQELIAARLGTLGWDISRGTLAKIEAGLRCVTDRELLHLANALRVELRDLFPATALRRRRAT